MNRTVRAILTGWTIGVTMSLLAASPAAAQEVVRAELNRADLTGAAGLEVVVSRTEIPPGARVPLHSHHGDEHVLVLQGGPVTMANGNPFEFKTGMAFAFPAGKVHGGMTATGSEPIVLHSVSIVEKDKPYSEPAE